MIANYVNEVMNTLFLLFHMYSREIISMISNRTKTNIDGGYGFVCCFFFLDIVSSALFLFSNILNTVFFYLLKFLKLIVL